MKKLFCVISFVGILLLFPILLPGQILTPELYSGDCIEKENESYVDTTYRGLYKSSNGAFHSPHGEIRFLVAFVELIYEGTDVIDPSPNGSENWPLDTLPIWKDRLLSPFTPNSISDKHITKYFQCASSNNHIVLGDYLVAPTNGGVFQVKTKDGIIKDDTDEDFRNIINAINEQMGDRIVTANGFNSISDFDKWSVSAFGLEKPNVENGNWDYVVFVVRNSILPENGTGRTGNTVTENLLGHNIDAYAIVSSNNEIPTHIIRHEYAHKLLGNNNFHTAGGGYGEYLGNYWIPQTGGWGLLGLYGCSLWCWNAWDRQRLGWIDSTSTYEISARNQNGIEVNGDLDATNPEDAGIYVLRDFVTTGDAIRIKLPFINSDNEYQEWLWIENHQGFNNNNNEFDKWQFQDFDCVEDFKSGLMIYMQINNDIRVYPNTNEYIYNKKHNYADYTRSLTANGLWDRDFLLDSVNNDCVTYTTMVRPFIRLFENPFTGTEDQSHYAYDLNGDEKISSKDYIKPWVEFDGTTYHNHLYQLGHTSHSFNLEGNRKIGMGTNPSSATLINMVGQDIVLGRAKNLRKTYLNGVSVEMLEQLPNGDIKIRIRFDDINVENDVRWCSDSIVLNPINNDSGYSLILKSGKTILFDQGLTATRMRNPMIFNNHKIFASPTVFAVMPNADIHLEPSSNIILDNGSMMHFSENSSCVVENTGSIEIKEGTILQMDDCSSLIINGNGKLIVRAGAELRISPNAILAFQNGLDNLLIEDGVNVPDGYVHPVNLINTTISNVIISENIVWNNAEYNVYGDIIIENNASLSLKTTTLRFVNKNHRVIVKTGGKLIMDNSNLTTNNCSNVWQGIEVWGNSFAHQYIINGERQQGYLELKNGATIENAICAVKLFNPSNRQSNGGVIYASDAVFRNNAKAVHAINYTNFNPGNGNEMPYDSHFRNCTFTIDNNYIGEDIFYKHVDIDRVRGIEFLGCSFSVDTNVPQVSESASGIAAYNAGFSVDSYCSSNYVPCPDVDLVRSTFTGFHDAVKSINDGSASYTFVVKNSTFNNNHRGVYAENTAYATILNNRFYVGSNSDCSFGIYANGVSGFTIEENSFIGENEFPSVNYGIAIKNSNAFNDIYLNSFENLNCGNISIGNNKRSALSSPSQSGLTYTCNNNFGNLNDFCVVRDGNVNGISNSQGASASAAGNKFTAVQYHFYNDGDNVINYYYSGGRYEHPDNSKSYRVTSIGATNSNSCISHYGGGNNTITRTAEEITELQSEYAISLGTFNELNNLYTSRIDGGNTQAEVTDINTATANDAMRLRSELLGLSPYLSQEVLTTAAQRDDVFSSSVLFEILSANPDELKKDTLISYLENKDNPMPQYMTELLREMANGTTARTALESQMAKSEREYLLAAGDIVRSNLNGEESDNEELRTWLANMNDMASDRLIVASYIQDGDYENAIALAEILPLVYGLQGDELREHNDYMTLVRLYETLYENGRSIIELTEEETLMVEEIAENGNGNSQMMAYSILAQNDETMAARATCPTLPSATNSSRGKVDVQSDIAEAMGLSVNLAPNPASSWSEIEYTLPADYNKAELVITNALGINVIKEELVGNYGRTTINLEKLPSGVYTYFVRCGEYVKTGKLIKN